MSNGYKQKLGDFKEVRHSYSSKQQGPSSRGLGGNTGS